MNKLKVGLIVASTGIVGSLSSVVLWNGIAHGEWDLSGLQQQVQHVTEVTDNHEARITNLESKVNTPAGQPPPTPVVITKVVTAPAPTVTPAPTSVLDAQVQAAPASTSPVAEYWYATVVGSGCPNAGTHYAVFYSDGHTEQVSESPANVPQHPNSQGSTSCTSQGINP